MKSQKTQMMSRSCDNVLRQELDIFSRILKGEKIPKEPKPKVREEVVPLCNLGLVEVALSKDGTATVIVHGYHHTESARLDKEAVAKLRKFLSES